eukprot:s1025_g21.t1
MDDSWSLWLAEVIDGPRIDTTVVKGFWQDQCYRNRRAAALRCGRSGALRIVGDGLNATFSEVLHVCSTRDAFAGVRANGELWTWNSKEPQGGLVATDGAFAVRTRSGAVVTWGCEEKGGKCQVKAFWKSIAYVTDKFSHRELVWINFDESSVLCCPPCPKGCMVKDWQAYPAVRWSNQQLKRTAQGGEALAVDDPEAETSASEETQKEVYWRALTAPFLAWRSRELEALGGQQPPDALTNAGLQPAAWPPSG